MAISVSVFTNASAFKLFQFPGISFPKWSKLLRTRRVRLVRARALISFAGFSHPARWWPFRKTFAESSSRRPPRYYCVPRHAFLFSPLPPSLTVSVADVSFVGANETRCKRGLKLSPYVHPLRPPSFSPRLSLRTELSTVSGIWHWPSSSLVPIPLSLLSGRERCIPHAARNARY